MPEQSDSRWSPPLRIGISACLLGQRVRYDGDHKRHENIVDVLSQWAELLPVCPEVAIGLGVPREPIRLEGSAESVRAIGIINRQDVSEELRAYGRKAAARLAGVSGYVFKSKSPSCGLRSAKLHTDAGEILQSGVGLYAAEMIHAMPSMPVEEESQLDSLAQCEHFIERVRAYRLWQDRQERSS